MWIQKKFPHIRQGGYRITSPASTEYNCIAWATGDTTRWWSTSPGGYYWPNPFGNETMRSLIELFTEMGYEVCTDTQLEDGFEKVALYEKRGKWSHAARQLSSGWWTSKLGVEEDIEHITPQDLVGNLYGEIHCIMKRVKS